MYFTKRNAVIVKPQRPKKSNMMFEILSKGEEFLSAEIIVDAVSIEFNNKLCGLVHRFVNSITNLLTQD